MRNTIPPGLALALGLVLSGCGRDPLPSFRFSTQPLPPGDSLTIRRVMGQTPAAEPLQHDAALGWTGPDSPRTTLGNPDEALRNVPDYRPLARPELERDLRPRGAALPEPGAAGASRLSPGATLAVPGGAPATIGAAAGGTATYVQPNTAGGVAVETGPNTTTLLGGDGSVRVVPR